MEILQGPLLLQVSTDMLTLTSQRLVPGLALQDSQHDDITVDMSSDLGFHIYFQKGHMHYKADVLQVQTFTFESCSGTRTALKPPGLYHLIGTFSAFLKEKLIIAK